MSFTDGKPWVVTDEDVALRWGGCSGGRLACGICGHQFNAGETCRWQFAGGKGVCNFIVCQGCDGPPGELVARRKALFVDYERIKKLCGYD